jgi:hypothetical protein
MPLKIYNKEIKKMKNITVDFEKNTITVTTNFAKRAGVVGSPEYHTLVQVMREFPDYKLCITHTPSHYRPSPYSRLTYADMETIIMNCEDIQKREEWFDTFEKIRLIRSFFEVKKWFVQTVLAEEANRHEAA